VGKRSTTVPASPKEMTIMFRAANGGMGESEPKRRRYHMYHIDEEGAGEEKMDIAGEEDDANTEMDS
jgi:hypothetical protein